MTLLNIAVFILGAIVYKFLPTRWRGWALLVGSILAIYWLQPAIPIRPVDFILPTATLILALLGWLLVKQEADIDRDSRITIGIGIALILGVAVLGEITRLINNPAINVSLSPSAPGLLDTAFPLIGVAAVVATLPGLISNRQRTITALILIIVAIFVILKAEVLAQGLSLWLRGETGRFLSLASPGDVQWLGFSYFAFRLIHTLRDRQTGKLPALTFREYLTYLIFFPAYTAGPIDRAERFVKDYRTLPALDAARAIEGSTRIAVGIFKKFVIADMLALFALSAVSATQAQTPGSMWLLVYAYAFRIYFDFSGYSDIAIGLGRFYSINLPENFDRPYLKDNITAFWNSWHITLSTWVRFYVFTPLSRALMSRPNRPSPTVIVLISQMATMITIGLWHGISPNFVIWGIWHGVGLFAHKLWTDHTRPFYMSLNERPRLKRAVSWISILLTFHFVALGWVWFALPDIGTSWHVLLRLFGLG